jgi:hypothetical protein
MGASCLDHHCGRATRSDFPTRRRPLEHFTRNRFLPVQSPIRARKAADAVRKHWGIENKQHYTRDVTFREDASRIRCNPGIFARLRSFADNILRFNQSDTIAQDRYAAALGGLEALSDMNYYKER